ncbi:HNH endonuclease [Kiloniella sp.]|uniref:HNH endonuclease n=1 Tax=Kiloniella sp. TaxID=1938587 RepID=UPI003B02D7C8
MSKYPPASLSRLCLELEQFATWLRAAGAEILEPTSEWEVLRFRGSTGVGIVYTNKHGSRSVTGVSKEAFDAYCNGEKWDGKCPAGERTKRGQHYDTLVKRDGEKCVYCGTTSEYLTLEHVVSLNCGGPNHINNLALACRSCNQEAGHLSAVEKFRIGEKKLHPEPEYDGLMAEFMNH